MRTPTWKVVRSLIETLNEKAEAVKLDNAFDIKRKRHLEAAAMYVKLAQTELTEAAFYDARSMAAKRSMKELSKPKQPKRK